jgi:LPXTG-motif cell wall-anchored protein
MNNQCTIEFDTNAIIHGVCDPRQYESPYNPTDGFYDPNWISCFLENSKENYIYCFHPNQGHGNGPFDECAKDGCQTIQPELGMYAGELPKTGANNFGLAVMIVFVLFIGFGIKKCYNIISKKEIE